jgi:hypothetical protein
VNYKPALQLHSHIPPVCQDKSAEFRGTLCIMIDIVVIMSCAITAFLD